jgi:uncharacterized protein (TIGR03032 family)
MTAQNNKDVNQAAPQFEINCSRPFVAWLIEQNVSLFFSTYKSREIFRLGRNEQKSLSVFARTFERAMGLWSDGKTLLMSNLHHLHRFNNTLGAGQGADGYDRLYVTGISPINGAIDVHDLALSSDGKPVFINSLFSSLATISDTHNFKPLWQPSFISDLQPEDRCDLGGLAMKDGAPAYVTAISKTNVNEGWRISVLESSGE